MEEQKSPKVGLSKGVGSLIILIIAVFITAIVVGGSVYYWQDRRIEIERKDYQAKLKLLQESKDLDADEVDKDEDIRVPRSFYTEIDPNTDLYTNNEFSFSIEIPTQMYHSYGAMCDMVGSSYRPKAGQVPVKVFEDRDSVFITSEYFYQLGSATQVGNVTNYSECEKVMNSVALLNDNDIYQQQSWELVFATVTTDAEITQFIKDRHGVGCELDEKVVSAQAGVFDVTIAGDGLDISETMCPINYRTVTKYSPDRELIVSWNTGQAHTFFNNPEMTTSNDDDMVASFQFE